VLLCGNRGEKQVSMDKNEFGKRVRQRRIQLGLSQEELAKRLGYSSRSTINKIENGTNDVVQTKVVDFAKALDTTVAYLMAWDDTSPAFKSQLVPDINDTECIVIKALRDSDKLTKQLVLRILNIDVNKVDEIGS
jgi:transcriptional regulator with XRE-family HTH domain